MKKLFFLALVGLFPLFIFGQSITTSSSSNISYTTADLTATATGLSASSTYMVVFDFATTSGGQDGTNTVTSSQFTGV